MAALGNILNNTELSVPLGLTEGGIVRRGKSIIPTSELRSISSYGLLPTPDRVQGVVLPIDGLLVVAYQALWRNDIASGARAAIFIGANQVTMAGSSGTGAPAGQEATGPSQTNTTNVLATSSFGGLLNSPNTANATEVTTGQLIGPNNSCGLAYIFAAAGTYDVSVQFRAPPGGGVTVNNRHLWVWTMGSDGLPDALRGTLPV
jgi:hypothetical protein